VDHDEAFIQAILAEPDDPALRLIYADWLDERDDPRGEFLRAEARLAALAPDDNARPRLAARLRELRARISPDWLARLDRVPVENCDVQFEFVCPRRWQQLQPTKDSAVRYCDRCERRVYYCRSVDEAREHAQKGHCIAVDSRAERRYGDLTLPQTMWLGEPSADMVNFSEGCPVTIAAGRWKGRRGFVASVHWGSRRAVIQIPLGSIFWRLEIGLGELRPAGDNRAPL
jgi:uncharacterized protein (TIGR02996 family)